MATTPLGVTHDAKRLKHNNKTDPSSNMKLSFQASPLILFLVNQVRILQNSKGEGRVVWPWAGHSGTAWGGAGVQPRH